MPITRSQIAFTRFTGNTGTTTQTFSSAVTGTNTVLVSVASIYPPTSITDNKGNTYVKDVQASGTSNYISIWRARNVSGGASFTVTLTQTGTGTRPVLWMIEEIGADLIVDKTRAATGSSVSPSTGTLTAQATGVDSYLMFGFCSGTVATTVSARPTYFDAVAAARGGVEGMVADLMDVARQWDAPASQNWTISPARAWAAAVVSYVVAPAPPTPTDGGLPALRGAGLRWRPPQPGNALWWLNFRKNFAPPPDPEPEPEPKKLSLITATPSVETAANRLERAKRELADILNDFLRIQQMYREGDGQGEFRIRGRGIIRSRTPTVDDDETTGVQPAMTWVDNSRASDGVYRAFLCADVTAGAAVWIELPVKQAVSASGLTGVY